MSSANLKQGQRVVMVTGLFRDRESAERAYGAASRRGDVDVLMSDETRHKWYPGGQEKDSELGNKAAEGAGVGGAIGAAAGATLGAIAAIGTSLALPGLGLVIAGPLAAGLAGAGAGSLAGGLIGALVGWGIPEDRAKTYEAGLRQGGSVLVARPRRDEDATELEREWKQGRGEHVYR
jgi:hypothetical protein